MTSSQSSTTNGVNRRTLVKGAAWSTPVIAAAAAVPAYASSIDSEIPTVKYGVFTQAFNSNPANDYDTRFGLDSYTVQVANASATSTTPQSADGGTFTPGGSVGAGLYGGAGLWFSAPINSKGEYQGKTYLQGGATLRVTLKFTFPSADEIIEPMLWDAGETIEPVIEGNIWTGTMTVTSGTLALELTDGGVQTYQDISGLSASATISR